ncbi:MAG TPA: MarR family transcriptional regulator [Chloroflexi bacterium]|nr:MarR family transcriptional regulator [Chloroflexota bacterium]
MDGEAAAERVGWLLGKVCRLHHLRVHQLLGSLNVYRGQPQVLHALWQEDGLSHSELAARIHITPATLSKMVHRMEKSGLLRTVSDPQDQRVSRIFLTEAGRAIKLDIDRVWHQLDDEAFAGFTPEQRELLASQLESIAGNLARCTRHGVEREGSGATPET